MSGVTNTLILLCDCTSFMSANYQTACLHFFFQYLAHQTEYVCLPRILCMFHQSTRNSWEHLHIPSKQDISVVHNRKINKAFHHGRHHSEGKPQYPKNSADPGKHFYVAKMCHLIVGGVPGTPPSKAAHAKTNCLACVQTFSRSKVALWEGQEGLLNWDLS